MRKKAKSETIRYTRHSTPIRLAFLDEGVNDATEGEKNDAGLTHHVPCALLANFLNSVVSYLQL